MGRKAVVAILLVVALAFVVVSVGDQGVVTANESEFQVVDASLSDDEVEPGETTEVTATLENVGDEEGTYTAELEVDGDVDATRTVTVDANESETVTFERAFDDPGEYELSISGADAGTLTVEAFEPEFVVREVRLSDEAVLERTEPVEVSATVANEGNTEGTYTAELEVDGDVDATRTVTVGANESETVTFERTFDDPGEYELSVGDADAATLTVEEPGSVDVVDASLSADWVHVGYTTTVSVSVENHGDRPANRTLIVTADGETVATETVRVPPGDRQRVDIEFEAVEGSIAVEDVEAGSLTVGETDGDGDGEVDDDATEVVPGFGVVAALAAVLVLGLAVRRQST